MTAGVFWWADDGMGDGMVDGMDDDQYPSKLPPKPGRWVWVVVG